MEKGRKEILLKPLWDLKDIQAYFEIGKTKASQMMQESKKVSVNKHMPSKAKRDVLLEINGLNFKEELAKMILAEVKPVNA